MIKLIKLELRRNNTRTYLMGAVIACVIMADLAFLFAYMPRFDPLDTNLNEFANYYNVLTLPIIASMSIFCVLSSVMYSKFIIEEFTGKRAILLFSYPIKRKGILHAKLAVVFLFTTVTMIISSILALSIFVVSEFISPLVNDVLTMESIIWTVKVIVIMSFTAASFGVVAIISAIFAYVTVAAKINGMDVE